MPTFNLVFEYQPIATKIATQPSRRNKSSENNLLGDEKGPHHWNLSVYSFDLVIIFYLNRLKPLKDKNYI